MQAKTSKPHDFASTPEKRSETSRPRSPCDSPFPNPASGIHLLKLDLYLAGTPWDPPGNRHPKHKLRLAAHNKCQKQPSHSASFNFAAIQGKQGFRDPQQAPLRCSRCRDDASPALQFFSLTHARFPYPQPNWADWKVRVAPLGPLTPLTCTFRCWGGPAGAACAMEAGSRLRLARVLKPVRNLALDAVCMRSGCY